MEGREAEAKRLAESHILSKVDIETPNAYLLAHIVAESLLRRIDRRLVESKNIYMQSFDIPQIVLFYKMAQAYPHVACSHNIANQCLYEKLAGLTEATILDIGIGKGKQMEGLLKLLDAGKNSLHQLTVIGMDPDPENVRDSRDRLEKVSRGMPFTFAFHPFCRYLEDMVPEDYRMIQGMAGSNLLVNSAFAMHHISHPIGNGDTRTRYFKQIRSLNPLSFVLAEPDSNHDTEKLSTRLHNCWRHFGTVFDLIDKSDIGDDHKFLVKEKFFGREIRDMFGVSDHMRSERHESIESWMFRFVKSGFEPSAIKNIKVDLPDHCEGEVSDGLVQLKYSGETLIGIFSYEPSYADI